MPSRDLSCPGRRCRTRYSHSALQLPRLPHHRSRRKTSPTRHKSPVPRHRDFRHISLYSLHQCHQSHPCCYFRERKNLMLKDTTQN